jgi:hypothetical protein
MLVRSDRQVLDAERVDRVCLVLIRFGAVDIGVSRDIDDEIVSDGGRLHGAPVRHVELGASERCDLSAARSSSGQSLLQVPTEHAGGAGDEIAGHSAARAFSGSHQARLSRYHCTTSASPWSNVMSGS